MEGLKGKTIRGGAARLIGQGASMALRLATIMVLARLLSPADFGIVAMVTVVTGVLDIFATGGLSTATVQKAQISDSEISMLFWINIAIGVFLAGLCLALAPFLSEFYHEPRTDRVMLLIAPAFIINAFGVQHLALLHRQLRYITLSLIELGSQFIAALVSIGLALLGVGYLALVAGLIVAPLVISICAWVATGWIPGRPRGIGNVAAQVRFGGIVTLNGFVVYIAYNLDKFLLGRYFGTEALGLYSRAYQLINLPTQSLNLALGSVVFAALSRLQDEPERLKSYFLKGYQLILSITLPITIVCAVLSDDIISVALGPKWHDAAAIFRLLSPTILIFGIINPLGWYLQSIGLARRSLNIAFVLVIVVACSYLAGLNYGPKGVAFAFSSGMLLWLVPHIMWSVHGTTISTREIFSATARPLFAGIFAAIVAAAVQYLAQSIPYSLVRLALSGTAMMAAYAWALLFVMQQKYVYADLFRELKIPLTFMGRGAIEPGR